MIFSPLGLSRGFSGFCATRNSRENRVAQKPLNHRRKVGGEKITGSERDGYVAVTCRVTNRTTLQISIEMRMSWRPATG